MIAGPQLIEDSNLSHAWARAFWRLVKGPGHDLAPLIVSIGGFDQNGMPTEDQKIRDGLDAFLESNEDWSTEIVAFTIFPQRYFTISGGDRHEFYKICFDALPHLMATNPHLNARGMYFERMMKFGRGRVNDNQLEFILNEFLEGRKRSSKYQVNIFDPGRDQTRQPYQTFPCLQTVTFVPTKQGLVVNAVYALQYLVQRAYGNFLGLAHLGAFMAREMKMPLVRLNVVAGVEKLDFPKDRLKGIAAIVEANVQGLETFG